MSDQMQQTTAMTQVVSPAPEACQELQVTYPCRFPGCKFVLDRGILYVPPMTWINREIGRRRPVTDWFSQATEAEMAEFARCKHHALESVVGQEYNRRKGIASMTPFGDVLRLAQHMLEQAKREKEEQAEAYHAKHYREKEERRVRRDAVKAATHRNHAAEARVSPKKYGDEGRRVVVTEPKPESGKGAKKKGQGGRKKGGR